MQWGNGLRLDNILVVNIFELQINAIYMFFFKFMYQV